MKLYTYYWDSHSDTDTVYSKYTPTIELGCLPKLDEIQQKVQPFFEVNTYMIIILLLDWLRLYFLVVRKSCALGLEFTVEKEATSALRSSVCSERT